MYYWTIKLWFKIDDIQKIPGANSSDGITPSGRQIGWRSIAVKTLVRVDSTIPCFLLTIEVKGFFKKKYY